jgi:hypothetical protein
MMTIAARNYVNLSNGIEALAGLDPVSVRFMRLQSTDCEHKHWAQILDGLPDDFLIDLALGRMVVVHDRSCSMRCGGLSRAQWQGLAWVRYALSRAGWGVVDPGTTVRGNDVSSYWRECWDKLPGDTVGRMRWYSRWVQVDTIRLECHGGLVLHDGDAPWQREQLVRWQQGGGVL